MIIDDEKDRQKQYSQVLDSPEFDTIYVWTRKELEEKRNIPVDGYIVDIFLDKSDWRSTTADELLKDYIQTAPRPAPVFLLSNFWEDKRVLNILKQAGESSAKVIQYLSWYEFQEATEKSDVAKSKMDNLRIKIMSELNIWHARSVFNPAPNESIRALIISDIQFGDPNTDPKAAFAENLIAYTLRQEDETPNLIVIAGDISFNGSPDQFALARERIEEDLIGTLFGKNFIDIVRDRIVVIPGNHDVNLRFSACDNYKFNPATKVFENETHSLLDVRHQRYLNHNDYALEPFRHFSYQLTRDRNCKESQYLTWVDKRFLNFGIRFFVLNTVSDLSALKPDHASFNELSMREITRSVSNDEVDSVFSIAVSHHGLRPRGASDSFKQVDNWETCGQDVFSMQKIHLWLYGHYHDFSVSCINCEPFVMSPLWLVQVPTLRMGYSNRGFCVLELLRDSGKVYDANIHYYVLENSKVVKRTTRKVYGKG